MNIIIVTLLACWYIVILPIICWFRKGTEGENKYGPVPDDSDLMASLAMPCPTGSWSKLKNAIVKLYRKYPKTMIAMLICVIIAIIPPCYYYAEHKIAAYTLEKEYGITRANYNEVLPKAASNGNIEIVRLLLLDAPGIDVNKPDDDGETPLYWAAWEGHTEIVKLLLAAPGIDVNKSRYGMTPLYWAAWEGHTEIVKLLLAAPGIDVNAGTPLLWAANRGHTEIVKHLLAAPGIDVNARTPLSEAAENGHTEIVKHLLAAPGIDVNAGTPLEDAAEKGHTEIVKLLLAAPGIDVNKANLDDETPLYSAASNGHTEIVKLLKAAGAKE